MGLIRTAWDRDGFARLLKAEFIKFGTVRAWVITLCTAAAVLLLLSFATAFPDHAASPPVPHGPGGEAVSDAYTFVHRTLAGDGTLTARVMSLSGTHESPSRSRVSTLGASARSHPGAQLRPGLAPWAKAGIMLEPDTRQGTTYAAVMVTGSHGVQMQYNYTHDNPGPSGPVSPSSPRWLRIARSGDLITCYDSTDGAHWVKIGAVRLTGLPRTVQVGLFVTSPVYFTAGASNGTPSVATASFDHVDARGDLPRRSWTSETIADVYPTVPSAATWQRSAAGKFTISGSGDIAPLVGGGTVFSNWSGASIVNGTIAALLVVIVLATLFITSEYRRGLIRITFAASPRRGQVLAAKAVVAGSLCFTAGAIATAIAEAITRHVLAGNGIYLFPQSWAAAVQVIVGTGLLLGLAAALAVALGAMLRRSVATVTTGFALLVLPGILATATRLPSGASSWLMRATPTAAFAVQATLPRSSLVTAAYVPANGYFPISPWAGLAVLAAYATVAMVTATWLLRKRDS